MRLLYGFYDRNYLVKDANDPTKKYILKISSHQEN